MIVTTPDPRPKPPRARLGQYSRKARNVFDFLPTNDFDASYTTIAYGLFRCESCKKVAWLECDAKWGWMFFCDACGYVTTQDGEEFTAVENMPAPRPRRRRKPRPQTNTITQLSLFT